MEAEFHARWRRLSAMLCIFGLSFMLACWAGCQPGPEQGASPDEPPTNSGEQVPLSPGAEETLKGESMPDHGNGSDAVSNGSDLGLPEFPRSPTQSGTDDGESEAPGDSSLPDMPFQQAPADDTGNGVKEEDQAMSQVSPQAEVGVPFNPLRDGEDGSPLRPRSELPEMAPPEMASADPTPAPPMTDPSEVHADSNPGMSEVGDTTSSAPQPAPPASADPPQVLEAPAAEARPLSHGRVEHPPFDPIKENGRFFVGWTQPKAALVITGRQEGYFEPCGCAGKDRMKGGLSRRHSMVRQLREQGWPVAAVDVGGMIKGFGKQTEIKFENTANAYRQIGYDAVNLGASELRLPSTLLLSVMTSQESETPMFISANAALFDFETDQWTARSRVVQAGDVRFGITGVVGKEKQQQLNNPDLQFRDPVEALRELVPELKQQAEELVLLAYTGENEALALAEQFPEFRVVVVAEGPAEPPGAPQMIPGTDRFLIHVGEKGMAAVVLGYYDSPNAPVAYQRVILDSRYPDSPEMEAVMRNYQAQLAALGLQGLEIRPVPHPRKEVQGGFVGSRECRSCHQESYDVWRRTGHANAWATLVNLEIPRTADPECISCHVTGWHPTEYFPYETGFLSEEETPELINVGCESCHGPGQAHVAAEMGGDLELARKAAEAMIVTKEQVRDSETHSCRNCHDLDNSPDFDFETYWPLVEHYE